MVSSFIPKIFTSLVKNIKLCTSLTYINISTQKLTSNQLCHGQSQTKVQQQTKN